MSEATDLAIVPKESALAVFSAAQGLDPYLAKIRAEIDAFVPDVSTRKGREAIASIAHKVARSKTALDNVGKELVAELKEIPKKVDAERKRMRDMLDVWRDEVRAPLNEWEAAEEARIAKHKAGIAQIQDTDTEGMSAALIGAKIQDLDSTEIGAEWEEFEAEAHRAKAASLETLRSTLATREKHEAEQAELERLRREATEREQKEREERIAREAAERAVREAEQRAQAEREAAERRELGLKLQAEQAEREKLQAQQRAEQAERDAASRAERAAAAERQRQADEQARIEHEAAAREADKEHKAAVNRAALEAFIVGGMPEECARQAVILIAQRRIPYVSITY